MAGTTAKSTPDNATVAWNELAERADALITAWQGDNLPPDLAQFPPAEPPHLRRLVLVELIKIDLEYRWQHHELPKQVEEYVEEFPELSQHGEVPCDLIYEEFHIRRQIENPPQPEQYFERFPKQSDQLRRMMKLEPNQMTTTSMVGTVRTAELEVGQQIDDFDLLVKLGKGSFGSVFLARQRSMQRLVALKISRDRGVEPQTLAQLDHPNIVRVYDQRVLADRKLQLMYMQHIPGGTLQEVIEAARQEAPALRSGKTLIGVIDRALEGRGESAPSESNSRRRLNAASWAETICWIGARLAAALDYAHGRGVLHRDIKPANVLLAAEGAPKLVDFNVSFSSKLEGATPAAYFGGSLAYMSPEQIEAYNPDHARKPDELDGRSDVYSLAVVLWELLTGSRPFGEEHLDTSWNETLKKLTERRHAGVTESALASLPLDLPPGLKPLLLTCLSPKPEDRPATAGIMARQLELCLQPRVQRLLRPTPGSWRQRLRRWPFWFFVAIGLAPSMIFSTLNLAFNSEDIVPTPNNPSRVAINRYFWNVEVPVVNAVSFSIAILLVVGFAWPVLVAVGRVGRGKKVDSEELVRWRRRALCVWDFAGWFGMSLWVVSGFIFPFWLDMHFGGSAEIGFSQYRNFMASQIACGLISSTLTFFLLTFMFVRAFYPVLVRPEQSHSEEVNDLMRLERRCGRCVYLTVFAPFFAVFVLAFFGTSSPLEQIWMGSLAIIGAIGCFLAFRLLNALHVDMAALSVAIDPSRDAGTVGSDTVESVWTGTR